MLTMEILEKDMELQALHLIDEIADPRPRASGAILAALALLHAIQFQCANCLLVPQS
jgi:hypothetical protein